MPVHELLAYILAVFLALALPIATVALWMLRRDIHQLRDLYSTLIEVIARREVTAPLTSGESPEPPQPQPQEGTRTRDPGDS
jgi:hypothetical protein